VPKVVGGGSPTKQYDGLPNTAVQPILKPTPPYHPGLLKRRWLINFQASSPARGHLSFPRGGATCVLAVCRISGLGGMHLTQKCWGRIRLSPRRNHSVLPLASPYSYYFQRRSSIPPAICGHLSFLGLVLLLCSAATTPRPCGAIVALRLLSSPRRGRQIIVRSCNQRIGGCT